MTVLDADCAGTRHPVEPCRSVADPAVEHGSPAASTRARARLEGTVAGLVELADLSSGATTWSGEDRQVVLDLLDRAVDGLAAVRARVLLAERECGTWQRGGDRSFEAWRGRTGGGGHRSAATEVRQADQLATVPSTVAAVTAGRIGLEHAKVIAKVAATGTPAQRAAAQSSAGQQHLLGLAEELDAGTFAVTAANWAGTVDPDALERDHEAQRAERFVHVAQTPHGTVIKGRLDSVTGHTFTLALEALTPRPAADDDRDPGQRRADALEAMAVMALAAPDTKPGGHVPPQISLILSEETWFAARTEMARRRESAGSAPSSCDEAASDGRLPGRLPSAAPYPPATLEDGNPIPTTVLAAALCDCEVTAIAVDAARVPVDLGRSQRLYTGSQRRAVIARDRECIWPGCRVAARWCDIHHLRWWDRDNGPTSIDNAGLLCVFHHHECHRRDLTITRLIDPPRGARGRASHPPAGQTPFAAVRYEFRDRTGRLIGGDPPPAKPPGAPPGVRGAAQPIRDEPRPPAPDAAAPPPAHAPSASPDHLDLDWVDDPVTGMRMPAFFVDRLEEP